MEKMRKKGKWKESSCHMPGWRKEALIQESHRNSMDLGLMPEQREEGFALKFAAMDLERIKRLIF